MTAIVAVWDGQSFIPKNNFDRKLCAERYVVGDRYILDVSDTQTAAQRGFFHAQLNDIYLSLPESVAEQFLSVDHFRKKLTIHAGYASEKIFTVKTDEEAIRLAAALQSADDYSIVQVVENVVRLFQAKTTKAREMDRATFSRLIDDVVNGASLLGKIDLKDLKALYKRRRDRRDKQLRDDVPEGARHANQQPVSGAEPSPVSGSAPRQPRQRFGVDEAISMLPDGDVIRSMTMNGNMIFSADWPRVDVERNIKHAKVIAIPERGPPGFACIGVMDQSNRVVYFETRKEP